MARRDPFARASRRLVRRLGRVHDIAIKPPEGAWQPVDAVFNEPVLDVEAKAGGKSGQSLLLRQPYLVMASDQCPGIEQAPTAWSVTVDGREMYVVRAYPKPDRVTYVYLADEPSTAETSPEGEGNGRTWY